MKHTFLLCLTLVILYPAIAQQSEYAASEHQYMSYGRIPTWSGVAVNWDKDLPLIHLYSSQEYKGHAEFVSRGLKTGITFKQFREKVKNHTGRKYLPFFLYDLRKIPVQVSAENFFWALRLEDYGYTDSEKEMGEEVLRLLKNISSLTSDKKGLLILSTSVSARPNTSIKAFIEKHGYVCITLSQLIEKTGSGRTKVLNQGTVFGYLRYVKAGESPQHLGPADVVVYEQLPFRVPPVAGFITLEPQTPLSHVNLLAINRGSVNVYISGPDALPGLRSLTGRPVKLSCKGDHEVSLTAASEEEVKRFAETRKRKVDIPVPLMTYSGIIPLGKDTGYDISVALVGAKAANYHRMALAIPEYVRPGYAIPFYYYLKIFRSCKADSVLSGLLRMKEISGTKIIHSQLEEMRNRILNSSLDSSLLRQIRTLVHERFGDRRIRLRSSTNCEDLPDFNGAGLYLSKGFAAPESDQRLEMKLLQIYASLWTPLAFEEREFYHIDHSRAGMSILINESFSDELANGVVLTLPGKDGLSILINSQPGDLLVTNPEGSEVPESILFTPEAEKYSLDSESSVGAVFILPGREDLLKELRRVSTILHEMMNKGQARQFSIDIEFKLMLHEGKPKLFVKQVRMLGAVLPE